MAFATTDDVATRLGRALTLAEEDFAEQIIATVTGLIAEACNRDADWAAELDPVPATLKTLCVEKVIAVGANPSGLSSESEQLGQHQHSKTYGRGEGGDVVNGVFLTGREERAVRSAVFGANAASSRATSELADEAGIYYDIYSKEDVPAEIVDP